MGQNNTSGKRWRTCSRFFPFWLFMADKGAFDVISDKIIIPGETFMPFQRTNDVLRPLSCHFERSGAGNEPSRRKRTGYPSSKLGGMSAPQTFAAERRGIFPIPKRIK